jgi:Ca-activated chloride channel family protein
MLTEFHFLRPWWLLVLVALIIALYLVRKRRLTSRHWERVIDSRLLPFVLVGDSSGTRIGSIVALGVAGVLAIVALAGPVWQRLPQPVFRSPDVMVIALDLSRSMDVADITPSRLARARFKIDDILDQRVEGQTALLVYAAQSFVVSPLTDDTDTIAAQLSALTTDLMPSQGSRADRAMIKARELIEQAGSNRGAVLLVTDGVDIDRAKPVASELSDAGIKVSVLGVGTADGGPIPGPNGFAKAASGSIVIASLERDALAALAAAGGGLFQEITADDRDVERLSSGLTVSSTAEARETGLSADTWREEGPWLVLLLLPFVALTFRRGVIVAVACVMMHPPAADAFEWADLWSRPDQRASRALTEGDHDEAIELFEDPAWKAAAEYRAERFEDSIASLQSLEDADATYNLGNALARSGRYEEAIVEYEKALEQHPDHEDAQFNRDLLLEQMQDQQQTPPQSDQASSDQEASPNQDGSDDQGEQKADSSSNAPSDSAQQQDQDAGQGDGQSTEGAQQDAQRGPDDPIEEGGLGDGSEEPESSEDELQSELAQAQDESDESSDSSGDLLQADSRETPDESQQAVEQWLRKIPDDPGGLLRRKFYYQYQRQDQPREEAEQW